MSKAAGAAELSQDVAIEGAGTGTQPDPSAKVLRMYKPLRLFIEMDIKISR